MTYIIKNIVSKKDISNIGYKSIVSGGYLCDF